ncbi:hypothetical protein AQUCO_03900203v1 [Aquilegia coerulea]|uniref:Uncharacterized protein n=1 Tax=Aquilegia coerulea TaxID=218851 RepID=A0A2G5CS56_AQUCA|nr:hypothetical protein AQUCO_03900203v1 [Aquilegia coerulea]
MCTSHLQQASDPSSALIPSVKPQDFVLAHPERSEPRAGPSSQCGALYLLIRNAEPVRHVKRKSDRHDLPPSRDLEPVRKRRAIEQEDTVKDNGEDTADKKQKASVFSSISFPGETGGNKKRKVPSEGSSNLSNGYKDQPVRYANGHLDEIKRSEKVIPASDHDSSDDDERHFKRRPARYEPPPLPPPIEWEEDVRPSRSSRERAHNKHRDR